MTKDDIKRWTKESGFNRLISIHPKTGVHKTEAYAPDSLERFAAMVAAEANAARIAAQAENEALKARLAAAGVEQRRAVHEAVLAERDACAKLCEEVEENGFHTDGYDCAISIRERSVA